MGARHGRKRDAARYVGRNYKIRGSENRKQKSTELAGQGRGESLDRGCQNLIVPSWVERGLRPYVGTTGEFTGRANLEVAYSTPQEVPRTQRITATLPGKLMKRGSLQEVLIIKRGQWCGVQYIEPPLNRILWHNRSLLPTHHDDARKT